MSAAVLIEAVEVEGFGGGGVVASAFGDVQVAGIFDGRGDGGTDGGQVGRPAAGATGRGVFAESHVSYVMMCLDSPVLAHEAGQVWRGGLGADQAGDGAGGLAGDLPGGRVLPPAGDLDGLACPGKSRPLTCAVFRVRVSRRPCPASRVVLPAGTCCQGRALTRACSSGWLFFTTAM